MDSMIKANANGDAFPILNWETWEPRVWTWIRSRPNMASYPIYHSASGFSWWFKATRTLYWLWVKAWGIK